MEFEHIRNIAEMKTEYIQDAVEVEFKYIRNAAKWSLSTFGMQLEPSG